MEEEIEKLQIGEGDILLVRLPLDSPPVDTINHFMQGLGDILDNVGAQAIVVEHDVDAEVLDEDEMRELGWVRRERDGEIHTS